MHLLSDDLSDVDVLLAPEGGNEGATSPTETTRNDDPADEPETGMEAGELLGTLRPL